MVGGGGRGASFMSCSDDDAEVSTSDGEALSHGSESSDEEILPLLADVSAAAKTGNAVFRALAPTNAVSSSAGFPGSSHASVASALALSHERGQAIKRKRQSMYLADKDIIGRSYAVARRVTGGRRGWAAEWAKSEYPERCQTPADLSRFLKLCRKCAGPARKESKSQRGARALSQGAMGNAKLRQHGSTLGVGLCTVPVKPSRRKRHQGAGGPGQMKCPELGEELFAWFVDSIKNVRGRMPSFVLLDVARTLSQDLRQWHEERKEKGQLPPHAKLDLPKLDYPWLLRWRRRYHITWRTVNLRFKCSRAVLRSRLFTFWCNVLRIRYLLLLLEPWAELVFEGMDQKPLWFTASSQEKTLALKGARKVAVKENIPMTRARFTAMTRCRWPRPPEDGKQLAVLFKAPGGGKNIRKELRVPAGTLLQFAEKGSYRLENVLEYLEWVLDRSRGSEPSASEDHAGAGHGLEPSAQSHCPAAVPAALESRSKRSVEEAPLQDETRSRKRRRVCYLLDWFAPHLDSRVDDLIHSAGHAILRIGGHLTPLVQPEDTHAHGPYTAIYKKNETLDAHEQLTLRPDKLPSTTRQTVLDRASLAWSQVNHWSCTKGFEADGIANALDGSQDGDLNPDVIDFWHDLGMPAQRDRIQAEVASAIAEGTVTRFEDYQHILQAYDAHAPLQEGQEAFGVKVDEDGAAEQSDGSATPPHSQEMDLEEESDAGFGDARASTGPQEASSQALASEEKCSVAVAAQAASGLIGLGGNPAGALEASSQAVVLASHDVLATDRARQDLTAQVEKKKEATLAALAAVQAAGGTRSS